MAGSAASAMNRIAQNEERWRACLAGVRAKDPGALALLYDGTSSVLYGLALRMLNDPEAAEEVMLGVYQHVWNSVEAIDETSGSILASLTLLTRSRALDRIRRTNADVPLKRSTPPPADISSKAVILRQEQQSIRRALATLSREERETVELAFFGGLTVTELATMLEVSVDTVKKRTHAGICKLREALTPAVSREKLS
jgi:RNA polymerase sigma-70 factor, ECF subfamily